MTSPQTPKRTTEDLERENIELRAQVAALQATIAMIAQKPAAVPPPAPPTSLPLPLPSMLPTRDAREHACLGDGGFHKFPATWMGTQPAPCVRCGWSPSRYFVLDPNINCCAAGALASGVAWTGMLTVDADKLAKMGIPLNPNNAACAPPMLGWTQIDVPHRAGISTPGSC